MRVYGGRPFELHDAPRPARRLCASGSASRAADARTFERLASLALAAAAADDGVAPRLRDARARAASRARSSLVAAAARRPRRAARPRHPADLAVDVPAGRPDRRRQVDELRPEHDRRRRRAGGGRRRRGVPRRRGHRARGRRPRTSGGGAGDRCSRRRSSSGSSPASRGACSWSSRRARLRGAEGVFPLADLAGADEAFTSCSVREVMPVVSLDGEPIGDGRPGEAAAALQAALREAASP